MSSEELGVDTSELDLDAIVSDMLSDRLSPQAARLQIAIYGQTHRGSQTGTKLADLQARLTHSIFGQLERLDRELSPGRALDLGLLLQAAARYAPYPDLDRFVDLVVGSRLLELGAPRFARDLLEHASANLDEGQALSPSTKLEIKCQSLRCLWSLGEREATLRDLPHAVEQARTLGDNRFLIVLLELDALACRNNPSAALARIDEAIGLRTSLLPEPDRLTFVSLPKEVELWAIRGDIARASGRFEEALRSFEKAREMATDPDLARVAAYMLSEIGITWQHAGEGARAAETLLRAAEEAERLGDKRAVLRWANRLPGGLGARELRSADTLANAYRLFQESSLDAALASVQRAIEQAREENKPDVEINSRNLLGCIYLRQNAHYRARVAFGEALDVARAERAENLELIILLNLCLLLINMHDLNAAQEQLDYAITLGERLRAATPSAELRQSLGGRMVLAYEWRMLLALGWEWEDGTPAQEPDVNRYLELSQQAQATNLAGWIAFETANEKLRNPKVSEAARALREAEARIERAAMGGAALGFLLEEREQRQRGFEAAVATTGQARSAHLLPIANLSQLTASLPPRTLLVDFFAAENYVSFAAAAAAGAPRYGIIPWKRTERLVFVERWEEALAAARDSFGADDEVRGWRLRADPLRGRRRPAENDSSTESLEALLAKLRRRFLGPLLESGLGEDAPARIFLSPHRELYSLPFWALARELPEIAFSILPTVGCLPFLARRVREPDAPRFKIGDTTGTLPYSRMELDALRSHQELPAHLRTILSEAPLAGMLHFAGHGTFDDRNPYDSGLVFDAALPEEIDSDLFVLEPSWNPPCRRLTVTGVLSKLELSRCRLVVLSACCTGLPRLHPASEFTSLPAALLVAGARSVVASLWPTHDGATALLMQEFYAELEAMGNDQAPAVALSAARRRLAGMPHQEAVRRLGNEALVPGGDLPFASPLFTMPFQVYGVD